MKHIIKLLFIVSAVIIGGVLLPGVSIEHFSDAIITAVIIALLNYFIKPIIVFVTLPVTVFTFGFFLLVINTLIIMLTDLLAKGFAVKSFWWALFFSIIVSLVTSLYDRLEGSEAD